MTWGVTGLRVEYGGVTAVDGVDLAVPHGEVTAVVGGDGAGKTTVLRVLAGVPLPYRGEARRPEPGRIGYVPTRAAGGFRDLTVAENLEFAAGVYGVPDHRARAAPLLERTGLAPFAGRLAGDLSGGMRQKLGVIAALLHRPDLLVLDEPTTGIDPVSRSDLWRLIGGAAADGAAVVVASAYLDEAERAATVTILQNGRTLVAGSPAEVTSSLPGAVTDTDRPQDPSRAWRRGARWREWHPTPVPGAADPNLEDVVIVAGLREEGR